MTDLISQLADAIVSLNNASPRLPTKAEIEDAICMTLPFHVREMLDEEYRALVQRYKYDPISQGSPATKGNAMVRDREKAMRTIDNPKTPWCPARPDQPHDYTSGLSTGRCRCGARKPA